MGHRHNPGGRWVLRGIDLALPARALVRVEGGNGMGKSTLLRLLAGIEAPAEGRITGRPARTAYVPERFPAALPLTVTGYLVHLGRIGPRLEAQSRNTPLTTARATHWTNQPRSVRATTSMAAPRCASRESSFAALRLALRAARSAAKRSSRMACGSFSSNCTVPPLVPGTEDTCVRKGHVGQSSRQSRSSISSDTFTNR
ncbi:hypothetical protein SBADM41S_09012 [Streptomyces badius]